MYSIVLYCIALYCIALYCIGLRCITLHCIVLYCIVLYCLRKRSIVLSLYLLYCIGCVSSIVLHCIAWCVCVAQCGLPSPVTAPPSHRFGGHWDAAMSHRVLHGPSTTVASWRLGYAAPRYQTVLSFFFQLQDLSPPPWFVLPVPARPGPGRAPLLLVSNES